MLELLRESMPFRQLEIRMLISMSSRYTEVAAQIPRGIHPIAQTIAMMVSVVTSCGLETHRKPFL